MNATLEEVNRIFLNIQDFFDPEPERIKNLSPERGFDFAQNVRLHTPDYLKAINIFNSIAEQLSPQEVIEGFQEGSRLLQRNLSGLMFKNFNNSYIPVMIASIEKDDNHVSFLFLRALSKNALEIKEKVGDLAVKSLSSQWPVTRQAALTVVYELGRRDAYSKISVLTSDPDPEVMNTARLIVSKWEGKDN